NARLSSVQKTFVASILSAGESMIGTAYAQAAGQAQGGDTLMGMIPFILMFVILYFLMIRPQMKKAKEHKQMLDGLQKGDEVVAAGILGKFPKITDTS